MIASVVLPRDIYTIIVDNLCDDKPSLKACSLVSSTWRILSQALLHRTMVFQATLPSPVGDGQSSGLIIGSEKARLLLETSSHLLRYVRSFLICGIPPHDLRRYRLCPPRVSDPSLAVLLKRISTLSLSSLASVELRHLKWAEITPDLQCALFLMISGGSIKEVSLVDCTVPFSIQWPRFLGPETRSLKLDEMRLFDDTDAEDEKFIENVPISSAPNFFSIHIGQIYSHKMPEWILHPFKRSSDPNDHLNSNMTVLRSHPFCERITSLSLYYQHHSGPECICKFIQAFPSLTTLTFNSYGTQTAVPLNKIIRISTLHELRIVASAGQISWLLSSFGTINSPSYSSLTRLKTIHIHMSVGCEPVASLIPPLPFPDLLHKVWTLDGIAGNIPNVEVTLLMVVSAHGPGAAERARQTKTTLASWRAEVKMLRLDIR